MITNEQKQVIKHIFDNWEPSHNYVYFRNPGDKAPFRVILPRNPSRKLLRQVCKIQARCGCQRRSQPRISPKYANSCIGELLLWLLTSLDDMLSGRFN